MECSQRNGEIDGYRLIYYPTMDSGDNESILIDGSNTNHFTIVGLQPRVEYTLTLGAVGGNSTLFGVNNSTSISTLTPQGKPFSCPTPLFLPVMLNHIYSGWIPFQ